MKDKLGREIAVGDVVVAAIHDGRLLKGTVAETAPFAIRVVFDGYREKNKTSRVLVKTTELAICLRAVSAETMSQADCELAEIDFYAARG